MPEKPTSSPNATKHADLIDEPPPDKGLIEALLFD